MKIKRARDTDAHDRQARKPRRRLVFAGLCSVILLLLGAYGIASLLKDTALPAAEPVPAPGGAPRPAFATPPPGPTARPAAEPVPAPGGAPRPAFATPPPGPTARPAAATVPAPATLANDVPLAWPAVGQAAVGSVEEGLLARSSANEALRPTASIAKVITALAIMDKQPFALGQEGPTYTITRADIATMSEYLAEDGSVLPLLIGMELTQYQAMQRMLIASDNNMADLLAARIFGSKEAYVAYAQAMLQRMGLSRTVVADASGFSPATASTPADLVAIGSAALQNPVIADIVAQAQAQLPVVGMIKNTNQLLGTAGVIGIKTGTTAEAGHCLLFAARYAAADGHKVTLVGVIMGDTNATSLYRDTRDLLESAKQGLGLGAAPPAGHAVAPPPTP